LFVIGLSDADRSYLVDGLLAKLRTESNACVVDANCEGAVSAHDALLSIADSFQCNWFNNSNKFKTTTSLAPLLPFELLKESPLKAMTKLVELFNSGRGVISKSKSQIEKTKDGKALSTNSRMVIALRFSETMGVHVLNNLLWQLSSWGKDVGCNVLVVGFIDALCSLPTLTPQLEGAVQLATLSTASAWDIYDELSARVLSTRDVPVTFTPRLIEAIHTAFEDSDYCITSAIHR
jgi:hypothetical protein